MYRPSHWLHLCNAAQALWNCLQPNAISYNCEPRRCDFEIYCRAFLQKENVSSFVRERDLKWNMSNLSVTGITAVHRPSGGPNNFGPIPVQVHKVIVKKQ